jgi:F-type H+-transporting ATPase subunit b
MKPVDNKLLKAIRVSSGTLLVFFLICGLAMASGGAAGHEGGHDSGRLLDLLYRAINFSLLIIILFIVVRKTTLKDIFSNRRESIKKNFDDLNEKKLLAEKRYQELERKLKEFEVHKKQILEQYRADGEREKERIIAAADQRAKQILSQAELTIQNEVKAATDKLKKELMDIATQKAQEIILSEIKDSDQDQLVDEFIKSVEKLH